MIVIPMAGLSSRFAKAGYEKPKYMLEAGGRSLFWHAVQGFQRYFQTQPFLFVYREIEGTRDFVRRECDAMGINDAHFIGLDHPTGGQAETVYIGLKRDEVPALAPVTIFNIDTIRPDFEFPDDLDIVNADGYLEVFRGSGSNWSFVMPEAPGSSKVSATTEKNPVSDLCCTGLYHFAKASDFIASYEVEKIDGPSQAGEYYVAPLYNALISRGLDIRYALINREKVIFSGVPSEYEDFRKLLR